VLDIGLIATFALGLTLVVSGLLKLPELNTFVLAVVNYEILPERFGVLYGTLVPPLEVAIGGALLLGVSPLIAGWLALGLLASFSIGVGVNLARGRRIDCHCFGVHSHEPLNWVTAVRLAILGLCAGSAILFKQSPFQALTLTGALSLLTAASLLLMIPLIRGAVGQWPLLWTSPIQLRTTSGGYVNLRNIPLPDGAGRPGTQFSHGGAQEVLVHE
jgi:hypothetical protein